MGGEKGKKREGFGIFSDPKQRGRISDRRVGRGGGRGVLYLDFFRVAEEIRVGHFLPGLPLDNMGKLESGDFRFPRHGVVSWVNSHPSPCF